MYHGIYLIYKGQVNIFLSSLGPLLVDFGEVCVQSVCLQKLELINRLSVFIWVQLEVDCPELQGSSPLSHVLPPCSHHTLPLTFQANNLGDFYRLVEEAAQQTLITLIRWSPCAWLECITIVLIFSRPVSYSVNKQHHGQIVVQAQVVPVALELSTTLLMVHPSSTLLAASGYRSSVTLRNQRNHTAEFTWQPVVTESGILFSIRPAKGTTVSDCEQLHFQNHNIKNDTCIFCISVVFFIRSLLWCNILLSLISCLS